MNERLQQLAALKGIAPSFRDIWGEEHRASDATLVALLAAMGVLDAHRSDEAAIDVAVREHEAQSARACRCRRRWSSSTTSPCGDCRLSLAEQRGTRVPHRRRGRLGTAGRGSTVPQLPAGLPLGYHRLSLHRGGEAIASCVLIVAPRRCYEPPALRGSGRVWGVAAQLYALRSLRNWGIGDYTDLLQRRRAVGPARRGRRRRESAARDVPAQPAACEPVQPVEPPVPQRAVPRRRGDRRLRRMRRGTGAHREAAVPARASTRCATPSWSITPASPRSKQPLLEQLYRHFRREHLARDSARAREFDAFRALARQRAAPACAVRSVAGALPSRRCIGVGLAGVAGKLPRSGLAAGGRIRARAARSGRVPRVPAMAGRSPARQGGSTLVRAGPGRRALRRSGGVDRPRRRRSVEHADRCTRSGRPSARRPTS